MDVLDSWCEQETCYWAEIYHGPRNFSAEYDRINAAHHTIFIVEIADGQVRVRPKPGIVDPDGTIDTHTQQGQRIRLYRDFIQTVVRLHLQSLQTMFALDVHDISEWDVFAPIFSFQKKAGSHNILMPDIDFMNHDWYRQEYAEPPLSGKSISATFVGASTGGGILTREVVSRNAIERLALAAAFVGNKRVRFKIAQAVQCDTAETAALLRQKPYFSNEIPWNDQLGSQFIISVDGNGATCSRVVNTLRSQSVLIRFSSHNLLYYFKGLQAWRHYIPVEAASGVDHVLDDHIKGNLDVDHIIPNANKFYEQYLSYEAVHLYMAKLIARYAAHITEAGRSREPRPDMPMLDMIRAHFANVGDLQFRPDLSVAAPQGNQPMEGIQLIAAGGVDPKNLRYRSRSAGTDWGEWTTMGGFTGTRGRGLPIVDLDFELSETAQSTYRLATEIVLDDGSIRRSEDGRTATIASGSASPAIPIVRLNMEIHRI